MIKWNENNEDNKAMITMLTLAHPESEELSKFLQSGNIYAEEQKVALIGTDAEKQKIFDLGLLCGMMGLSSTICYHARKDYLILKKIKSGSAIPHFNDVLKYMDANRYEIYRIKIKSDLNITDEELSSIINAGISASLIKPCHTGFTEYALQDDGYRYVAILRKAESIMAIMNEEHN